MAYDAALYMHDLDQKTMAALRAFPMLPKLQELYSAYMEDPATRTARLANAVRLSEKQMPEIYNLLPPICQTLGIDVPELYYVDSKEMNAYTAGITTPVIVLYSGLVKKLPPALISTVLAHECGHIACKHNLYYSLANNLISKGRELVLKKAYHAEQRDLVLRIYQNLSPALERALLFWSRCSEFSADRAAILCDGGAKNSIELMLRIHGYDENINTEEFVKQALELKALTDGSPIHRAYEIMMTEGDSHPRLAARARESYLWARSDQYRKIISGVWVPGTPPQETQEIIAADITLEPVGPMDSNELKTELDRVNRELDRYTSHADKADYAVAVASGALAGLLDSFFVGEFSLQEAHDWGSEKTERFVIKTAKWQGYKGDDIKGAILFLAEKKPHKGNTKPGFHLPADSNTKDFGGGIQHHLRDFAHHGAITGLFFSMLTQFTGNSYGTDEKGIFKIVPVRNTAFIGKSIPEKILYGSVYWFFHLVSDVAGSGTLSEGTGIPGPLLSAAKLLAATPLFASYLNEKGNREFSVFISKLFNGTYFGQRDSSGTLIPLRFDMRTEVGIAGYAGKMAFPVMLTEALVRAFYFIRRLVLQLEALPVRSFAEIKTLDWQAVKPWGNRTVDRMLTVSSLTFTVADTTDAAVHAAIESGGNWVLFAGKFACRFNYIGAGRAAMAVVKEVSSEAREAQLIHERMLLTEAYSTQVMEKLQAYKAELEEKVSEYLAEDIQAFLEGFAYMEEGLRTGDSNLVIRGNVVIQRVLGREPQFKNQAEFDDLMESDIPLIL